MEMGLVKNSIPVAGRTAGPGQADYLLVIYPRGDLGDRLLEEQQQFNAEYFSAGHVGDGRGQHPLQGQYSPEGQQRQERKYPPEEQQRLARNKPHITLAAFQAGEETEDTVIRWIQPSRGRVPFMETAWRVSRRALPFLPERENPCRSWMTPIRNGK